MSRNRRQSGGWADPDALPKGSGGKPLCRRCGAEVAGRRRTFCSEGCVHEWRIRTDPQYMRAHIYLRDRGVCAVCGLDTAALRQHAHRLDAHRPRDAQTRTFAPSAQDLFVLHHRMPALNRAWWEADHIVPVVEGGGECGLDNIRTLCVPCHKDETAALAARRAQARRGGQTDQPRLFDGENVSERRGE